MAIDDTAALSDGRIMRVGETWLYTASDGERTWLVRHQLLSAHKDATGGYFHRSDGDGSFGGFLRFFIISGSDPKNWKKVQS